MATRLYFPYGGPATTWVPGEPTMAWGSAYGGNPIIGTLAPANLGLQDAEKEVPTGEFSTEFARFVYGPLAYQTLDGWTGRGVVRATESHESVNGVVAISMALCRYNAALNRLENEGTFFTIQAPSPKTTRPPELLVSSTPNSGVASRMFKTQGGSATIPIATLEILSGYYLLIGIGAASASTLSRRVIRMRLGQTTVLPDLPWADMGTADGSPWFELSGNLLLQSTEPPPPRTGNLSITFQNLSFAATGTIPANRSGSLNATLASVSAFATGTVLPNIGGSVIQTLAPLSLTSAGGSVRLFGTFNRSLNALTALLFGTTAWPVRYGTLNKVLDNVTTSSSGTVQWMAAGGSIVQTLDNLTANASGLLERRGSLNVTLSGLTQSASGSVAAAPTGAIDRTLDSLLITATGSAPLTRYGTLNVTLANISLQSVGQVLTPGAAVLNVTLASLQLTNNGVVLTSGEVDAALATLVCNANGVVYVENDGVVSVTLAGVSLTATASSTITGNVTATLNNVTLQASSAVPITGDLDVNLCPGGTGGQRKTVRFLVRLP